VKKTLLSGVLVLALALTACQNESDVTAPPAAGPSNEFSAALNLLDQLDLTNDQLAFIDEMYYLDEDMSVILDGGQEFTFNQITDGLDDRPTDRLGDRMGDRLGDRLGRPGFVVDMDALMYYRLILKACPEHSEEDLASIRQLIAESNRKRAGLVRNATDKQALLDALKAEHNALIDAINDIIGAPCIAAIQALKEDIQTRRDEMRKKMVERRIAAELAFFTKLLSLTEDQVALVKTLLETRQSELARLREQYKNDPEGLRAALQALMETFDQGMLRILDDEQDAIYLRWRGRTVGDRPDPNTIIDQQVAHFTKLLGLSERQAAHLRELLMKKMAAEKRAHEAFGRDRIALARALQRINQEFNEAFVAMLTPEQLEIWKRLHMRDRRGG
jgi:hypothetical protein